MYRYNNPAEPDSGAASQTDNYYPGQQAAAGRGGHGGAVYWSKIEIASNLTTDNLYFLFYQSDHSEISTIIHITECHSLAV